MSYQAPIFKATDHYGDVARYSYEGLSSLGAGLAEGIKGVGEKLDRHKAAKQQERTSGAIWDALVKEDSSLAQFSPQFYAAPGEGKGMFISELTKFRSGQQQGAPPREIGFPGGGRGIYSPATGSVQPAQNYEAPAPPLPPQKSDIPGVGFNPNTGGTFSYEDPVQASWSTLPEAPEKLFHMRNGQPSGAVVNIGKAQADASGLRIAPIEDMEGYGMLMNGDTIADNKTIYRAEEVPGTSAPGKKYPAPLMPGLPPGFQFQGPPSPPKKTWKPTRLELDGDGEKTLVKRRKEDADGIQSEEFFTFDKSTGNLVKAEPSLMPMLPPGGYVDPVIPVPDALRQPPPADPVQSALERYFQKLGMK